MDELPENTASNQALSNPLILNNVLEFIWADKIDCFEIEYSDPLTIGWFGFRGVLFRCCLVNRTWFDIAVRILWRDTCDSSFAEEQLTLSWLMKRFANDLVRAQYYASLIESGTELSHYDADDSDEIRDALLANFSFPRLRSLILRGPGTNLPLLNAPVLVEFTIDTLYDSTLGDYFWGVKQKSTQRVLDQIAERFPDAERSCLKATFLPGWDRCGNLSSA